VRIWNLETGREVAAPIAVASEVRALAIRADGQAVLIGCLDGETALWDLAGAAPRLVDQFRIPGPVSFVDFRADGTQALVAGKREVRLWTLRDSTSHLEPFAHPAPIYAARYSPDGKRIVICGENNAAQLWSTETGLPVGVPMIHQGSVVAAAFSPDSRVLATGSLDRTARFWEVETGAPIGPPLFHNAEDVTAVAFGPLNRLLTTGDRSGRVRFWEIPHTPTERPEEIYLQLKVRTGLELHRTPDRQGAIGLVQALSADGYRQAVRALEKSTNAGRPSTTPW
jgi:WD40 repeat protein